jgi:flagellar hook-basal body complex protein FliE
MQVNGIAPQQAGALTKLVTNGGDDTSRFQDILTDALRMAAETEAADNESAKALLTGSADDIADVVIASQKAEIALRLTVQIRNRIVDAYNEVMRMQI